MRGHFTISHVLLDAAADVVVDQPDAAARHTQLGQRLQDLVGEQLGARVLG
jgi:hypothetical protein